MVDTAGATTGRKCIGTTLLVVPFSAGAYLSVGPEPERFGGRTVEVV